MINTKIFTMPRTGSSAISAPDLLNLLPSDNKNGFLRQKSITKFMKVVKWRHRFVVLAQNALYIYDNEMSRGPDASIPLLGYLAVERETTATCPWGFALVPSVSSLKRQTFACSSDSDRKDWMLRIKDHLFTSNNVTRTNLTDRLKEKIKLMEAVTAGEREYLEIELPVKSLDDSTSETTSDNEKLDNGDSSDEEDTESPRTSAAADRKSVLSEKRQTGRDSDIVAESSLSPPRYSAVVEGEEVHYENHPVNPKAQSWGLERAATIVDENMCRDRDKCIAMLKHTKLVGTYLIRKSRFGDYIVLSVLIAKDVVKELRVELSFGLYHFMSEPSVEFSSMESLLAYYTTHKTVPNLDMHLGWGIHECAEGDDMYDHVEDV